MDRWIGQNREVALRCEIRRSRTDVGSRMEIEFRQAGCFIWTLFENQQESQWTWVTEP